jgi:hypothetical protein
MKALGKQQGLRSITYTTYHVKRTAVFLFPLLGKCCGMLLLGSFIMKINISSLLVVFHLNPTILVYICYGKTKRNIIIGVHTQG